MDKFFSHISAIILSVISTFIAGFVLVSIWAMLIVPSFHVEPICIRQAVAVDIMASVLMWGVYSGMHQSIEEVKSGEEKNPIVKQFNTTIGLGVFWLFAYYVRWVFYK